MWRTFSMWYIFFTFLMWRNFFTWKSVIWKKISTWQFFSPPAPLVMLVTNIRYVPSFRNIYTAKLSLYLQKGSNCYDGSNFLILSVRAERHLILPCVGMERRKNRGNRRWCWWTNRDRKRQEAGGGVHEIDDDNALIWWEWRLWATWHDTLNLELWWRRKKGGSWRWAPTCTRIATHCTV